MRHRFAGDVVACGGVLLLPKRTAIRMVEECVARRIRILGIDGFWFDGKTLQPSLDNSVDLSSEVLKASYRDPVYLDPILFLETRHDGLMFEIVLEE